MGVADFMFGGRGFAQAGACHLQQQQQLSIQPPPSPHLSSTLPFTALTQHNGFHSASPYVGVASQPRALPLNDVTQSIGSTERPHPAQRTPEAKVVKHDWVRSSRGLVPVCWDLVSRAAAAGTCEVLSIRMPSADSPCATTGSSQHSSSQGDRQSQQQRQQGVWLATELALAGVGCMVKLVTPQRVDLTHWLRQLQAQGGVLAVIQQLAASSSSVGGEVGKASWTNSSSVAHLKGSSGSSNVEDERMLLGRITPVTAQLGLISDPFAAPPLLTLDALVAAHIATSRYVQLSTDEHHMAPNLATTAALYILNM